MSNDYLRKLEGVTREAITKTANILGVPYLADDQKVFEVIDGSIPERELYITHREKGANPVTYGWIRGVVVDHRLNAIVRRTFGHEPRAVLDEIPEKGPFRVHCDDGVWYDIDAHSEIVRHIDGVLLSVMFNNGKVLYGTHKMIDIRGRKARIGSDRSRTFEVQLAEMGGIRGEELFDMNMMYSPHVHYFMLAHPELLKASKMPLEFCGIYYLGSERMWGTPRPEELAAHPGARLGPSDSSERGPTPKDVANLIDDVLRRPAHLVAPGEPRVPGAYFRQTTLTRQQASDFLASGYYDMSAMERPFSPNHAPGECLIVYVRDSDGRLKKTLRLNSSSYAWRESLLDAARVWHNLRNTFYKLLDSATRNVDKALEEEMDVQKPTEEQLREFAASLTPSEAKQLLNSDAALDRMRYHIKSDGGTPELVAWTERTQVAHEIEPLPRFDAQDLFALAASNRLIYFSAQSGAMELPRTHEQQVYNLWQNMLLAVPISRQLEAFGLISSYYEGLHILAWFAWHVQDEDVPQLLQEGQQQLVSYRSIVRSEARRGSAAPAQDIESIAHATGLISEHLDGDMHYHLVKSATRMYREDVLQIALQAVGMDDSVAELLPLTSSAPTENTLRAELLAAGLPLLVELRPLLEAFVDDLARRTAEAFIKMPSGTLSRLRAEDASAYEEFVKVQAEREVQRAAVPKGSKVADKDLLYDILLEFPFETLLVISSHLL